MKFSFFAVMCAVLCLAGTAVAENRPFITDFDIVTDFAYYPLSAKKISVENTWFAPPTGLFSAVEARVTGNASVTLPIPFGDNPLVSGNFLRGRASFELSPVTVLPYVTVSFSPVAFLVFSAGGKFGTGWDFIGIHGMAKFNSQSQEYASLQPGEHWYSETWMEGLFQFDLAALMPGEWNHVVIMATYKLLYTTLTGYDAGKPWMWQTIGEKVNGANYYANIFLGYQMPLVLQTVGVQTEFYGYYSADSFNAEYIAWNPTFMTVDVNLIGIFKFNERDSLAMLMAFSSRRGFAENNDGIDDLAKNYEGREWFFRRIAFSYTHKFKP